MKLDVENKTIDEKIKLYNGDCLEILKYISDKSVDLVIIDPPYELESERGGGLFSNNNPNKRQYQNEISNMMNGISNETLDLLGSKMKKINMYIFCSRTQMLNLLNYAKDNNYSWNLLMWHKTNPIPTCNNKYLNDTEYIVYMREKGVKIYGNYHTKKTYFMTPINKADKKEFNHPTIKPLEIIKNLIINSSNENDIVLDCFMGSGTTGVACKELKRNFIGIELNEKYFEIAKKRIEEKNNQATIFGYIDNNAIKENEVI